MEAHLVHASPGVCWRRDGAVNVFDLSQSGLAQVLVFLRSLV